MRIRRQTGAAQSFAGDAPAWVCRSLTSRTVVQERNGDARLKQGTHVSMRTVVSL
jgi:hypothetical protein